VVGEAEGAEAEGEVGAHHAEAGAEVASESAAEELEVEGAVDAEDSAEAAGLGVEEEEGEGEDLVVVGEGDLEVGDESLQFIVLWTEKSFVTKMLQIVPVHHSVFDNIVRSKIRVFVRNNIVFLVRNKSVIGTNLFSFYNLWLTY